jgi:hypothetical protein
MCGAGFARASSVLDPLLSLENPWTLTQDDFQKATAQMPFEWTSNQRDSARAAAPGMTLFGLPVAEVVARFESAKLREITVLLFGRGDSGELTPEKFGGLIKSSSDALNQFTKVNFATRGKDAKNAVKADGRVWQTDTAQYVLEYSFTREVKSRDIPFRAEFVRLEIAPPVKAAGLLASLATPARGRFSAAAQVQRDAADGRRRAARYPDGGSGPEGLLRGRLGRAGHALLRQRRGRE